MEGLGVSAEISLGERVSNEAMSKRFELDEKFQRSIAAIYGDSGEEWLRTTDQLVAELEARWSIACDGVLESSMSFVTHANRDGKPFAVLKLMPAASEYFTKEVAAHRAFAGAVADLQEWDAEIGAMLTKRVTPGDTLSTLARLDDSAANEVVARCARSLQRPLSDAAFPTVSGLVADFDQYKGSLLLPDDLVSESRAVFERLANSQGTQLLLHGDLHHANILNNGSGWTVIDPQGIVGEAEYELAAPMRNPFAAMDTEPDLVAFAKGRAREFSNLLALDEDRILQWAFAQTTLSLCWQVTDGQPVVLGWLRLAQALRRAIT